MLTPDLTKITTADVDELRGIMLNIAYAIYVKEWKWVNSDNRRIRKILVDEDVPEEKVLNLAAFRYIGDGLYIYKNLPKYDTNCAYLINEAVSFDQRKRNLFVYYLKETVRTEKRFALTNATSLQRARAIVKVFVHLHREKKRKAIKVVVK